MARFSSSGPRAVKPRGPDRRFNGRFSSPYVSVAGLPWNERRKTPGRRSQEGESRGRQMVDRGETLFLSVFEDAPEAMAILNRQGTLLLVNRQCEHLFGYRRENLFGHSLGLLVPERYRAQALSWQSSAIQPDSGALRLTLGARRLDGGEFPLEMSLARLHGSRHFLLLAVLRDITACSQALVSLQEENAQLTAANVRMQGEIEFFEQTIAELNQLTRNLRHPERAPDDSEK